MAWNLNGGGAQKIPVAVERLHPDVLIASECGDPADFPPSLAKTATSSCFVGASGEKGLACLSYGAYNCRLATDLYNPELLRIAPVEVDGPTSFHLLAVWADNSERMHRPAITALEEYRAWLTAGPSVVAGDFNDGPQWERHDGLGWAGTIDRLTALGLRQATRSDHPTQFMYRNLDRPYGLDHAFVPDNWSVEHAEVGRPNHWLALSDHMPIVVDTVPTT